MGGILILIERQPLVFGLAFSAIPYVGLRFYLGGVMHAEKAVALAPGTPFLLALLLIGSVAPAGFLVLVVRRLVAEKERFQLRALLEVYFALVLIFAVSYAVLQASGLEPSFNGMPVVWDGEAASEEAHLGRLHDVFGNALYLSIVTMTTVGFGDIIPVGFLPKSLTALQGLLGIGFVGLVLGQYFASCVGCEPVESEENA